MNRKLLIVMLLTAVMAAEGCRRGGGEKKPALGVQKETDFLYTRKGDVLGSGLDPIAKTAPGAGPVLTAEQQKLAQDEAARQAKKKAEDDKTKRRNDTVAMGNFLLNYRKANTATIYSHDDLKKALRRQKLTEMYDDLDSKKIEVAYLADTYNPNHIICYHKTAETEEDLANKKTIDVGHPAVFGGDPAGVAKFGFVKAEDVQMRLKKQEMLICWQYYVQYATPHFYRTSAEFPAYVPSALTPPVFLGKIKAKSPELLKNPPDEPDFDRFKKYLTENAPPHLLKLVESNTLCVKMKADLRVPGELVACWDKAEAKDKDGKEKGQLAIDASANVQFYDPEIMKLWIAQNPAKKGMP
jgi:hypothetical protein